MRDEGENLHPLFMFEIEQIEDLSTLLDSREHIQITHGMSGAHVFYLPELGVYLKVAKAGFGSDLRREKEVLDWLNGKAPVAKSIRYETHNGHEYFLMSEIKGIPASEYLSSAEVTTESAAAFIKEAGGALRELHELAVDDCPFDQRLDVKFSRSRRTLDLGLLSETEEEFAVEHNGKAPLEVLQELIETRPAEPGLVFAHGDPCMPNIIIHEGEIAGFIDLDNAGTADRYSDFAIFFRSFQRNCRVPVQFEKLFCEAYGIDDLDPEKMRYYSLLDDLF